MPKNRASVILLAAVGLIAIAIGVYYFFFAGSGYVEGRPTFKYFRLET